MRNVFDVLMRSQAALSQRDKLPQKIDSCNKKDALLVDLFEEKGLTWVDGGNTLGKSFLLKLRDVLWYINGHHAAFANRSLPIPEIIKPFYLKECLLTSWIQQERWWALREIINELATSLTTLRTYANSQEL